MHQDIITLKAQLSERMKRTMIDKIALFILLIGGINWGLV